MTAGWLGPSIPALRREGHYGDRFLPAFRDRPRGLNEMLAQALAANPDGEALVDGERRLTYRALAAAVEAIASGMAERGVAAGDRVALMMGNRLEFVLSLYAVARLGAIAVPLSIKMQRPECAYALGHCGAAMIVHDAEIADRLPSAPELPGLKLRICAGQAGAAVAGSEPFEALADGNAAPALAAATLEEDTAVILYTSGTTGRPKGAMLTHLNFMHTSLVWESCLQLTRADRSVIAVPMSHVTGLTANMLAMLRCAGTLVVLRQFSAADFMALAARERMTHTVIVPAMYNLCLRLPDFDRYGLSAWRIGCYGGAPMPAATIGQLAEKLPRLALMNSYGATETTGPSTIMPAAETAARRESVGLPVPGVSIVAVDEAGRALPPGEVGELWIGGANIVKGYWTAPEATAEAFTGGFWHSGDLGMVDAEGFIHVLDRKKDMINRGGYKVFSAEVESVMAAHPTVVESAIVAKPCPVLGERVHAFIVVRDGGASEADLRRYCADRLADYKVPESCTLQAEPLPRNANGKVMKRLLRERLLGGAG